MSKEQTWWEYFFGKCDDTIASPETIRQRNLMLKQIRDTENFRLKPIDKDVIVESTKPIIIPKRKRQKNKKKHVKRSTYEF